MRAFPDCVLGYRDYRSFWGNRNLCLSGWNWQLAALSSLVQQFFMRDFRRRCLAVFTEERLSQVEILITFNGKCFDLPLESRFVMHRRGWPLAQRTILIFCIHRRPEVRRGCGLGNLEIPGRNGRVMFRAL
jgi:uncharacterized protein YprB with RNaseH-like and TPR domain